MRSILFLFLPLLAACAASLPPVDESLSPEERRDQAAAQLAAADSAYKGGDVERAIALSRAALQVYPAGDEAYLAKWTYLNHQVEAAGLGTRAAEVEADLEALAGRELSAESVGIRTRGYEQLYAWTAQESYRAANRALLEAFLSQGSTAGAGLAFLSRLRPLFETPPQAEEAYRRILAAAPQDALGHFLYAELARLAIDHPDGIESAAAEADFSAWSEYLGVADGERQTQFYLWRAEYQLQRQRDNGAAAQWLQRAEAARPEGAAAMHARLHLLVGDSAKLEGTQARAKANYQAAWELTEPLLNSAEQGGDFARTVAALRLRLDQAE